jgi:hypothetical protein
VLSTITHHVENQYGLIFFLKGTMPQGKADIDEVVTLAYQTVQEQSLDPKEILTDTQQIPLFLSPMCYV